MLPKDPAPKAHERYNTDRLMALTDGVIAIALTLLVLGIDIPSGHDFSQSGLELFLIQLEPGLLAYATSFIVITVYWTIHQRIYSVVAFTNSTIVLINIVFLFSISLFPFLAKMKSMYKFDSLVVVIYATAHIFTGLILFVLWKYFLGNPELLKYTIESKKVNLVSWSILVIPLISLLAIGLSFINVHIATYLFFVIPIPFIYLFQKSKPLF
jgi:uncharacterized membrane protein